MLEPPHSDVSRDPRQNGGISRSLQMRGINKKLDLKETTNLPARDGLSDGEIQVDQKNNREPGLGELMGLKGVMAERVSKLAEGATPGQLEAAAAALRKKLASSSVLRQDVDVYAYAATLARLAVLNKVTGPQQVDPEQQEEEPKDLLAALDGLAGRMLTDPDGPVAIVDIDRRLREPGPAGLIFPPKYAIQLVAKWQAGELSLV